MSEEVPLRIAPDMVLSRRVDFERRMRRLPRVTVWIAVALALIFVDEGARGALDSADALIGFGALYRPAVAAGQVWRLVSATWLHGSFEHLLGNAVALFILGMVCEHAFGGAQFLVLYVAAGVAGSLVSLWLAPGPSVGASGAIFGLQGAAIVLFRRHRARLLLRDRRIGVVLLVWGLYTIGTGIVTPYIDNGAHIGGFVAGALIARRLHPVVIDPLTPEQAAHVRRAVWLTAAVLAYALIAWLAS